MKIKTETFETYPAGVYPVTVTGKIIASLTASLGVILLAIPSGLFIAGAAGVGQRTFRTTHPALIRTASHQSLCGCTRSGSGRRS